MITRSDQIVGVYQRFLNHIKHDYLGEIIVCLSQYYQVLKAKLSLYHKAVSTIEFVMII